MQVLRAVIDDLYSFAMGALFQGFSKSTTQYATEQLTEDTGQTTPPEPIQEIAELDEEAPMRFRSPADIFAEERSDALAPEKNTLMYIGGNETRVHIHPTKEFDSVVARLPYGAMVMALEQKGRWTRIVYNTITGWVLREELMDRAAHVYPHFVLGEQNTIDDPNTVRVRAMLDDQFAAGDAALDLQAAEYVTYRLMRKGLTIDWPETRPRTPGTWHTILRGISGIHVGVVPKTGSVMEYMYNEDIGHLAYVEAVFPDETINISEVHYPDRGIYNERVLTREEWRELKPVFIQVT